MPIALSGSLVISGSITTTGAITMSGSIASASYAATSSYANAFTVANTLTAQTLVVQTITSSIEFVTGSTKNGSTTGNTHQFTGSLLISGSVGIGSSSISEGVQGVSSLSIIPSSSVSGGPLVQFAGNGRIRPASTGDRLSIDGNALYLNSTFAGNILMATGGGNVGVGISSPTLPLEIAGNAGITTNGGAFIWKNTGSSDKRWDISSSGNNFAFNETGVNARMIILAGGNVGMGTTTPGKRLELYEDNSSTTSTTGLKITNFSATTDSRAGIVFQNYDNNGAAIWGRRTGSTAGHLVFGTNSGTGTTAESAIVERMRIDNAGNVGIGITTPYSRLDINGGNIRMGEFLNSASSYIGKQSSGNSNFYSSVQFYSTSGEDAIIFNTHLSGVSAGERMRISGAGYLGIGTTNFNSSSNLTVEQDALNIVTIRRGTTASNTNAARILFQGLNASSTIQNTGIVEAGLNNGASDYYLGFYAGTSAMNMKITSAGNVGIGTTSPTSTLDINGTVRYRGGIYSQFTFNASGNYSSGTWYDVVNSSQLSEGVYVITGYVDTYAVGGGIYFMQFVTVPFYFWGPGCNSTTYTDLPEPIGSGHHKGSALPLFRLQHTNGVDGKLYLKFNPNANWSNIQPGVGGATFNVYLKRIGN